MPKELTHWILAERALRALPHQSAVSRTISAHHEAFLSGAVLPDTLMHLFRGPHAPTALELANRFHDPPNSSYRPLLRACARYPEGCPPPLFACLLGVVSHMQADIALHPYVFSRTGQGGMGEHYRLETLMDLEFLKRAPAPPVKRLSDLVNERTHKVLVTAMELLFDAEGKLPRQALEQALQLHCRFQGMYDRLHWKVAVGLLGRILGAPYNRQRHLFYPIGLKRNREEKPNPWRDPVSQEVREETVEQLGERAVQETAKLFMRIEEEGVASALSDPPGANLLTGQ